MFVRLLRRLHRDRRRIMVAGVLLFASGLIEVWGRADVFPTGMLEAIFGFVMVVFVGGTMLTLGIAWPKFRHAYAPIALTLFGTAVLGRLFPGSAFSLLTFTEGGLRSFSGLIVVALFVHQALYGKWLDGWITTGRAKITARGTSDLLADALWHGLMPTPGRREALFDNDVLSVDWVDRDRSRLRIIRWSPPAPKCEEYIQIEDIRHGSHVLYSYAREHACSSEEKHIEKGFRALKLIDMVDQRVVYVTELRQSRPVRRVVFDWLDDTLGRRLDAEINHLEASQTRKFGRASAQNDSASIGGPLRAKKAKPSRARPTLDKVRPAALAPGE